MASGAASLVLLGLVLDALGGLERLCPKGQAPSQVLVHGGSSSLRLVHTSLLYLCPLGFPWLSQVLVSLEPLPLPPYPLSADQILG